MQVEAIAVKWQAEKMASCWQSGSAWWCQSNSVLKTFSGSQHRAKATTMASSITLILWAPRVRLLRSSMSLCDTAWGPLSGDSLWNSAADLRQRGSIKRTAPWNKTQNRSCHRDLRQICCDSNLRGTKFSCVTCVVSGEGRSWGSRAALARAGGSTGKLAATSCRQGDACPRATAPYRSNDPWHKT